MYKLYLKLQSTVKIIAKKPWIWQNNKKLKTHENNKKNHLGTVNYEILVESYISYSIGRFYIS